MVMDPPNQLASELATLVSALEDGARVVAYTDDPEYGGPVLVLWHKDGSEERLSFSIDAFQWWLDGLPKTVPET